MGDKSVETLGSKRLVFIIILACVADETKPRYSHFMAFFKTLVIAFTIQVGIMSICCCPVQIFTIN